MADDIRDFQIAVADAIRLNDCYHELLEAFCERSALDDDDQYLRKRVQSLPQTPEGDAWVHRVNSGEVAERYMRVGIMNRHFPLWIRTAASEELVDYYAVGTVDNRTLTTGIYLTFKRPMPYLYGRPLWVKRADWRAFFRRTMEERYGVEAPTRAPSFKAGRPPSDEQVLAKADEMRARGMKTYEIASSMRCEPGFENTGTRELRALLKGRWSRPGRAGITEE